MSLSPGQTLLHYRLAAKIGEGGMGEVWRATDTTLGREVAIKVLPAAFAADPERMARFEREAKVLASLNHPGIAAIHGFHVSDGVRFLALELVDGEDLSEHLARGAPTIAEALLIARRIAEALEYAHEQGIVHRDLKPANVKITPDGGVKILDFGLAKAIAGDSVSRDARSTPTVLPTMTSTGTVAGIILGTAAYMSPEQARGKLVDKRTDIWAFGCVLFECLTGRQLYEGETVSDLIAKVLQTEPDLGRLPAATPARVRALIARCLQKDAKDRLRDIGEARIVLASQGDAEPASATPARARGVPVWAAAAGALALAALSVLATLKARPGAPPPPLRRLDLAVSDLDVDWSHAPVLSPDGRYIAYLSKSRVWVRDLTELTPRVVADVTSSTPIGWSPDSRFLVFAEAKKLLRVTLDGGKPTAVCEIPGTGNLIGVSWSPSDRIAFSVWRGGLYTAPAGGGSPQILVDNDPATTIDFHAPSWLSNGEILYLTHWNAEVDASGHRRTVVTVFDGKTQIPVAGDLGDDEAAATVTATGDLLFLRAGANAGLWAVPFDLAQHRVTGTPILLAPDAVSASAARDGSLLYVEGSEGDEQREMIWVERSGTGIQGIGPAHPGLGGVALSPDGRRVAFRADEGGNSDVWVRDLERGMETRLTFGPDRDAAPTWLGPSRVAFLRVPPRELSGRIFAINADGSGGERQIAAAAGLGSADNVFAISPDGKWAVRIVDDRGRGRLRVGPVLPDGTIGALKPLLTLDPEPDVQDVSISPDGKLLAYVTNEPGQVVDLFLTRFPGGVGRWQVGTEGGRNPRWARISGELFYSAGVGPSRRAMTVVKVDSSQDPPLAAASTLFDLSGDLDLGDNVRFDVAGDGRRFLFTRPAGRTDVAHRRMVLVQNWRAGIAKGDAR